MQEINRHQTFVVFTVVLVLSMTVYSNGHFRDLFSYYEHAGDKSYDSNNDGWSVDLDAPFEMADEFNLMLKNIDDYEYPANSVIVVNQGTIVREIYYNDFSYSTQFNTYSVTKSFTSALVGIAIDQGIIGSVDDPVVSYFPNATFDHDSPEKQSVTIRHVLTMTSGFDYGEDPTLAPPVEGSVAMHVLNSPVTREPGTSWVYDSQAPSILTRIIEIQSNMSLIDFANEYLFDSLGIQEVSWGTDDTGLAYGGFSLYLTSREMAKFGQLFLQEGMWNDEEIISKEWVRESTLDHMPDDVQFVYSVKPSGGYGYLWWTYDGFYTASGLHGQRIIINPISEYVVVFTSLDVTQEGADNLHMALLKGDFAGWEEPMTDFYKRSVPYFGLLLIFFTIANFAFLKYGPRPIGIFGGISLIIASFIVSDSVAPSEAESRGTRDNQRTKSRDKNQEMALTSFCLSFYSALMGFLATLLAIFIALDLVFSSSRGVLFPNFQWLTMLLIILIIASIVLLERDVVRERHGAYYTGMLKFEIPKAIFFLALTIFLFFNVYLKMVADFSA
jgi:CubicO group peptidase (beta-lactamase class C family)